jgi:hypothetical protein
LLVVNVIGAHNGEGPLVDAVFAREERPGMIGLIEGSGAAGWATGSWS